MGYREGRRGDGRIWKQHKEAELWRQHKEVER